jgi:Glycine-zipper domain
VIALLAAGCSTARPILYPNPHYKEVGLETAQHDVQACRALAHDAGASESRGWGGDVAGSTALGAGVGAASGAVGGAVVGAAGSGSAIGAASGATASLLYSLLGLRRSRPSDAYVNFVNQCLVDRGYQVTGWQ